MLKTPITAWCSVSIQQNEFDVLALTSAIFFSESADDWTDLHTGSYTHHERYIYISRCIYISKRTAKIVCMGCMRWEGKGVSSSYEFARDITTHRFRTKCMAQLPSPFLTLCYVVKPPRDVIGKIWTGRGLGLREGTYFLFWIKKSS